MPQLCPAAAWPGPITTRAHEAFSTRAAQEDQERQEEARRREHLQHLQHLQREHEIALAARMEAERVAEERRRIAEEMARRAEMQKV